MHRYNLSRLVVQYLVWRAAHSDDVRAMYRREIAALRDAADGPGDGAELAVGGAADEAAYLHMSQGSSKRRTFQLAGAATAAMSAATDAAAAAAAAERAARRKRRSGSRGGLGL